MAGRRWPKMANRRWRPKVVVGGGRRWLSAVAEVVAGGGGQVMAVDEQRWPTRGGNALKFAMLVSEPTPGSMADRGKEPAADDDQSLETLWENQANLTWQLEELSTDFRRFSVEIRHDLHLAQMRNPPQPHHRATALATILVTTEEWVLTEMCKEGICKTMKYQSNTPTRITILLGLSHESKQVKITKCSLFCGEDSEYRILGKQKFKFLRDLGLGDVNHTSKALSSQEFYLTGLSRCRPQSTRLVKARKYVVQAPNAVQTATQAAIQAPSAVRVVPSAPNCCLGASKLLSSLYECSWTSPLLFESFLDCYELSGIERGKGRRSSSDKKPRKPRPGRNRGLRINVASDLEAGGFD
ncbi:hypothetical protein M5K25_015252 [Dendrobium thyrsiflorum]|uniref:Uncharacterized protein n=1 Tax=Dendrobium thyrsiflorum TaxID=117978 RepID=A0ABD0UPU5_DENTH